MRIAILTPGGVDRSGTERVIPCFLWLIERLTRAGDDVHVFAFHQEPQPGNWPLLGAQVHNAGGGRWAAFRVLRQLVAEHRRSAFQVLHAMWPVPAGIVAALAGRLLRIPVLLHFVGGELADLPDIRYGGRSTAKGRIWLRLAVAGADRIVAPSNFIVDQARALGIVAERVPFGVATDRWPVTAPRPRAPGEALKLLHVASLNLVKDQGMLLETAARLSSSGIDFVLKVIGEDTLGGAIQRQAREFGLSERVQFLGFLPNYALRKYVESADILVVTSRHEAGPVVALEAAAAGVPVAGTKVGHLADWAPLAARVVEPGDSAGLTAVIVELASNETECLRLASHAQMHAVTENADVTTRRFRAIYRELIR